MSDDPIRGEHRALYADVRRKRHAFAASLLGSFARAMTKAMTEYHQMRGEGVSREDACRGLEAVIRDAWPKSTTKFGPACDACEDTGWTARTCRDLVRCGRRVCITRHPSWEHRYVVPCDCPNGDRYRPKAATNEDALANVGKRTTRRRKGFARVGS